MISPYGTRHRAAAATLHRAQLEEARFHRALRRLAADDRRRVGTNRRTRPAVTIRRLGRGPRALTPRVRIHPWQRQPLDALGILRVVYLGLDRPPLAIYAPTPRYVMPTIA